LHTLSPNLKLVILISKLNKLLVVKMGVSEFKNDLLPLNDKVHRMKTGECEKWKINDANTERLNTFSFITMQKYLNEEHRQNIKSNCDRSINYQTETWLSGKL
jgi:hypothetical protein